MTILQAPAAAVELTGKIRQAPREAPEPVPIESTGRPEDKMEPLKKFTSFNPAKGAFTLYGIF